ncbi:MAG: hypothetical protein RLZZ399_924 [Verrucomicrobiota bacterium]|jgi:hypothetical protein
MRSSSLLLCHGNVSCRKVTLSLNMSEDKNCVTCLIRKRGVVMGIVVQSELGEWCVLGDCLMIGWAYLMGGCKNVFAPVGNEEFLFHWKRVVGLS